MLDNDPGRAYGQGMKSGARGAAEGRGQMIWTSDFATSGYVILADDGNIHATGVTAQAAIEQLQRDAGPLDDGDLDELREAAEQPGYWDRQGMQIVVGTRRLIDAVERFGGAGRDIGHVVGGRGIQAVADLPVFKAPLRSGDHLVVAAPACAHAEVLAAVREATQLDGDDELHLENGRTLVEHLRTLGAVIIDLA